MTIDRRTRGKQFKVKASKRKCFIENVVIPTVIIGFFLSLLGTAVIDLVRFFITQS